MDLASEGVSTLKMANKFLFLEGSVMSVTVFIFIRLRTLSAIENLLL